MKKQIRNEDLLTDDDLNEILGSGLYRIEDQYRNYLDDDDGDCELLVIILLQKATNVRYKLEYDGEQFNGLTRCTTVIKVNDGYKPAFEG